MQAKFMEENKQEGDLVGIEKEFQDIYGQLKKLQEKEQ